MKEGSWSVDVPKADLPKTFAIPKLNIAEAQAKARYYSDLVRQMEETSAYPESVGLLPGPRIDGGSYIANSSTYPQTSVATGTGTSSGGGV